MVENNTSSPASQTFEQLMNTESSSAVSVDATEALKDLYDQIMSTDEGGGMYDILLGKGKKSSKGMKSPKESSGSGASGRSAGSGDTQENEALVNEQVSELLRSADSDLNQALNISELEQAAANGNPAAQDLLDLMNQNGGLEALDSSPDLQLDQNELTSALKQFSAARANSTEATAASNTDQTFRPVTNSVTNGINRFSY